MTYQIIKLKRVDRPLMFANLLIIVSISNFCAASRSIAKSDSPSSLSCAIEDRKYVFISFSLENDRSALATVTGRVRNRAHTVVNSGTDAVIYESMTSL